MDIEIHKKVFKYTINGVFEFNSIYKRYKNQQLWRNVLLVIKLLLSSWWHLKKSRIIYIQTCKCHVEQNLALLLSATKFFNFASKRVTNLFCFICTKQGGILRNGVHTALRSQNRHKLAWTASQLNNTDDMKWLKKQNDKYHALNIYDTFTLCVDMQISNSSDNNSTYKDKSFTPYNLVYGIVY